MKATTLSPAEMEIAERIALGESKKEVADHTFRSVYTVETTVKNIYEKLGFSKISETKRKVFALALLTLIVFDTVFAGDDIMRARRTRTRSRRAETEVII